jgi:TonB-dependent Receptor Plug Domain/CarboxypepD_reg-like domain
MKGLYISVLAFIHTAVFAQTGISGKVIDKITKEPVEYAMVQWIQNGEAKLSDREGRFDIAVATDSAELLITGIGYEPSRMVYAKTEKKITVELNRGMVNLKELVLTSGHINNNASNAISKIDLKLRPVKSSQELLRNVPGLFIAQHQGGGKAEQIFLRGYDIDHGTDIQVTVDGLPVNLVSHAHGQGYADLHFVIPELIKNIDYGKGPYYKEYGNLNTAAYVQLETQKKLDRNTLQVEGGRFNSFRALAMLKLLDTKKQDAYIASEMIYSDGPFKNPQRFNRFNVQARYNLALTDKSAISFTTSLLNSRWNAGGQIPQRAIDNGTITRFGEIDGESGYTGRFNASLKTTHQFSNNSRFENQAFYSRYHFNLFSNFTFFLNDPVNGDQIKQKEKRDILGYQAKYSFKKYAGNTGFVTTAGAGIRNDRIHNSELSHTKNMATVLDNIQLGDINETNAWLYADEKISMGKWLINPGIRADWFNFKYNDQLAAAQQQQQSRAIVSPALNLQYNLSKKIQLYVKTGKGFHSNDTRVVLDNTAKKILPAVYGTDFGISWKPVPQLLVNAAVWYIKSEQEFVYVGDEGIVEAGGRSRRQGVDLSLRWQLTKNLFADANINLAKARAVGEPKGSNYIPLAPSLTSTGGINYQATSGLNGSLRYRYIKNRPANEDGSVTALGYFVADASVNYTKRKYEIGLAAENIFNTKWNEAQFETTSRLKNEAAAVTELHFTPGTPFFVKARIAVFF